jgi:hypothetical protein
MTLRGERWQQRFFHLALLAGEEKVRAVASTLAELSAPVAFAAMLDEFVADVAGAVHYESESYTHANGYDKIVLFHDTTTRMKMRLHIWWPMHELGGSRTRQNVHNHRWDFASAVLLGSINHATYRFARRGEQGEDFFHYRYYGRGSKEHYDLEGMGKASLVFAGSAARVAGEVYCVGNEVLHRVDVGDNDVAGTLVITHENVNWVTNDLLSEKDLGADTIRLASPAFTKEQVLGAVSSFGDAFLRKVSFGGS